MVELKLHKVAGIVRVGGLEEQVAPDLELLQNPRRTAASRRQGKTGKLAQPLGMVTKEFVKDSISVHLSTLIQREG
jgi:hypothetical protein